MLKKELNMRLEEKAMIYKRAVWLIMGLLLLGVGVALGQPLATNAVFDEELNEIQVTFDSDVYTSQGQVILEGIIIEQAIQGRTTPVTLRGGIITNDTETGTVLRFKPMFEGVIDTYTYTDAEGTEYTGNCWGMDYQDLVDIETNFSADDTLRIFLPARCVFAASGEDIASQWLGMTYIPTLVQDEVQLQQVGYDAALNKMSFHFNSVMQYDQIPEDLARPHPDNPRWPGPGNGTLDANPAEDRNDNNTLDFETNVRLTKIHFHDASGAEFIPASALDMTRMDSDLLEMELSRTYRAALERLDLNTLTVSVDSYAFVDTDYNPSLPVVDMPVAVTLDPDTLRADSARYDLGNNQLFLYFNMQIDPQIATYIVIPKIWMNGYSDIDTLRMYLSGNPPTSVMSGNQSCRVTLKMTDSRAFEEYYFSHLDAGVDYELFLDANGVISSAGNGNYPSTAPLTFIDESTRNKAPEVVPDDPVYYDAFANQLYVPFDVRLDAGVDLTGFSFILGDDTLKLSGGAYERTGGNRAVLITLTGSDELLLETSLSRETATLNVDPFTVLQQTKLNGNRAIEGVAVEYRPDPNPPLPKFVFYDSMEGRLIIESKPPLPAENVQIDQMEFQGITPSEYDSVTFGSDDISKGDGVRLIYYLSEAKREEFAALPLDDLDSVVVTFHAGFLTSGDNVVSEELVGKVDKDSLFGGENATELLVGYGRDFYVRAFQVFPTIPRRVHASIRKITEHATWYVSNDEWTPMNLLNGAEHRDDGDVLVPMPYVTPMVRAEIDSAARYFEEATPKDPNRGAYAQVLDYFAGSQAGRIPDRVDILFADVYDDFGEYGRNDSKAGYWKHGYFRPDDLPGSEVDYSNEDELFVVDCYPQSFNVYNQIAYKWNGNDNVYDLADTTALRGGLPALANLFTEYVTYKVDKYEKEWARRGLAYFSEFLVDDLPTFYGEGVAAGLQGGNILTSLGADYNSRTDYIHLFMFYLYLWEKYGGNDLIREISESPRVGMDAIQNVISHRQDQLDSWLQGKTVHDIYLDFATANLLDTTYDAANDHGIYEFENITTRGNGRGTQLKWKPSSPKDRPPFSVNSPEWGFNYYYTSYGQYDPNLALNPETDTLYVFAGEDAQDMMFRKLDVRVNNIAPDLGGVYLVEDFSAEDGSWDTLLHRGKLPMSPNPEWILGGEPDNFPMWILVSTGAGDFNISNHYGSATFTDLFVAQNPTFTRKLDLYIISDLALYNSEGDATPFVFASSDAAGTDTLIVFSNPELFTQTTVRNDMSAYNLYLSGAWITEPGVYYWHLGGFYENGESVQVNPAMFETTKISGQIGQRAGFGEFNLAIGDHSLPRDMMLNIIQLASDERTQLAGLPSLQTPDELTPVSASYSVTPADFELEEPVTVSFSFDPDVTMSQQVGIYLYKDDAWHYIGGTVHGNSVTARTTHLGVFRAFAGSHGDIDAEYYVPSSFAIHQNYPNPFNPTTTIGFELPSSSHVSLVVYDVLGRRVTSLVDNMMRAGVHQVVWNGKSKSGRSLSSGIYFVQMRADSFTATRKMMLVK